MGNVDKLVRYLKRNGVSNTYYAVMERLFFRDVPFNADSSEKRAVSENYALDETIRFSIVVPVYETKEEHLRDMIDSVLSQIYGNFELVLADASKSGKPKAIIESYRDDRIKYVEVKENKSISDNTNVGLMAATGDYVGLLDHDDLLTEDALYECALEITECKRQGISPLMIYSDEDKCNGDASKFFSRHYKQKLNLDLLLSNNYICHFTVIENNLIKTLKFRGEYNGSQDYDLFLSAVGASKEEEVRHIPKVLYHWRCHEGSTAFNPASKEYAYIAGKKAIMDFVKTKFNADWDVVELSHKGFYRVVFEDDIFEKRPDIGAIGGRVAHKNKITSGILYKDGTEIYSNMNRHFTGYMHRAVLSQDVYALDIRTLKVRPELEDYLKELLNELKAFEDKCDFREFSADEYAKVLGLKMGERIASLGMKVLFTNEILDL